ncbi:hypothetical protein V5O48_001140 [Marasmius crinis-equi]|uniref:Alpha/beta-hydrolase n=1 Tax=Marasmius crinis-equi TaxID=585013 RepID=A0ABR3FZK5_9AGAR
MNPRRFSKGLLFLVACVVVVNPMHASAWDPSRLSARDGNDTQAWTELSWDTLQPSKDLHWVPCYSAGFQCTRLQVPLNYNDTEGDSAVIALVRLPANVSSDSPTYRGPVLFNPGGPGDSGVDYILQAAASHQSILGPQFDIVGFDPRGVQRSTPRIEFYTTPVERAFGHHPATELNNNSRETVESYWANTKNMGTLAYKRGKDYLAYMNTDHSARDMLSIVEAHGREKLQYWGFSYGSVLGYTFAAMFPDKVERLIIDGVVDVDDYYTTQWLIGLKDIHKTLEWFFTSCKEAGPGSCAFYEDSVGAMESKLEGIYAKLIDAPIPVVANISYGLVDYNFLRSAVLISMYAPTAWPSLAEGLQAVHEGNQTFLDSLFQTPMFECDCDGSKHEFDPNPEALNAYICNDGDPVPPGVEEARAHYQESVKFSEFGSFWACFRIACNGWSPEIPKAQFRGPITGNTSFPMLIIGNTADPVTSIDGAKGVNERFSGSVLLTQDSPGHASVAVPSVCTGLAVKEYFVNGTLPKEGTVCPITGSLFDGSAAAPLGSTAITKRDTVSDSDEPILKALQNLAKSRAREMKRHFMLH